MPEIAQRKRTTQQVALGVRPADWQHLVLQGKVAIAHGFAFASEYFANYGPYRLTTPGHFYEAGGFKDVGEKQKYYAGPVLDDYVLEPGDVIVAMTEQADGLLGSAAVIPAERGYLHNQRLGRVTALSSEVDLSYLVYVFNSPAYRAKVRETAAGTKVKHTSPEKLLAIAVPLPTAAEQRAIAAALNDVDALLGALDRLIAKKRDLKQAAMQQLLTGQMRLPGFSGKWGVKRLGQSCELITKGTTPTSIGRSFTEVGVNFLKAESIAESGETLREKVAFIDATTHKLLGRSQLKEGDLLLSIAGVLGRVGRVSGDMLPGNTNQALAIVRLGRASEFDLRFLFFSLRSPMTTHQISDVNVQAAQANISLQNVGDLEMPVPPTKGEQVAIAAVLSEMETELLALEQRRAKTLALKQGMTQELLTGRIRLV